MSFREQLDLTSAAYVLSAHVPFYALSSLCGPLYKAAYVLSRLCTTPLLYAGAYVQRRLCAKPPIASSKLISLAMGFGQTGRRAVDRGPAAVHQ